MSRVYETYKTDENFAPMGADVCPCGTRPIQACGGYYGCDVDDRYDGNI